MFKFYTLLFLFLADVFSHSQLNSLISMLSMFKIALTSHQIKSDGFVCDMW